MFHKRMAPILSPNPRSIACGSTARQPVIPNARPTCPVVKTGHLAAAASLSESQIIRINAGQKGHRQELRLFPGPPSISCCAHSCAASVDCQEFDFTGRDVGNRPPDCLLDIIHLKIQENAVVPFDQSPDESKPFGNEKLVAHLEKRNQTIEVLDDV